MSVPGYYPAFLVIAPQPGAYPYPQAQQAALPHGAYMYVPASMVAGPFAAGTSAAGPSAAGPSTARPSTAGPSIVFSWKCAPVPSL
ncbi:hypothetical protein NM688_g4807 [Phlebia brevispora]|uniref:Uncharacterized protein n=1 Tax=Phlebia brevispora TaxID=194682 RepID=A0ACC1T2H1_9APHY|nr:hypothetical protein NM688_g4807 [Phlebia brevispora]